MNTSQEMYTEIILDYYNNPKNFGKLNNADIKFKDVNPSCGDEIEIEAKVKNKKIENIKFNGKGCAISLASAELLTENLKGKTLEEARELTKKEILNSLGINLSPLRLKCALLCLKVFKYGLYAYIGQSNNVGEKEYE